MASVGNNSTTYCDAKDCGNVCTMVCSGCHIVRYCCKECQRKAWKKQGHRYECKLAAEHKCRALELQDRKLEATPERDYFLMTPPAGDPHQGGTHGLKFLSDISGAVLRVFRSRAACSPYCVGRMYTMLQVVSEDDTPVIPLIRKQLWAEYGIDPLDCWDQPPVGEITDEDFVSIQQSLGKGMEEARLLAMQPPPNPALQRQNDILATGSAEEEGILYVIFTHPLRAVTFERCGVPGGVMFETFKILRKRASISPLCVGIMYRFLKAAVVDKQKNSAERARIDQLLCEQLQAEHGFDPLDRRCHWLAEGEADVGEDAARYCDSAAIQTLKFKKESENQETV